MKQLLANLRLPALIGLIFSLPFMVLDYVNRRQFNEGFPFGLFALMWALGTGFVFTLVPILRDLRARKNLLRSPIGLALRVATLIVLGWLWFMIVQDQMACFLGVPNCD